MQSVVVGAGIVGICTALCLQERGRQVLLVDRLPPGEGTSSGNAGIISVGSVLPEAMPGVWKEIPLMLLQRQAPVSLKLRYLPQMLNWFYRFLANSSAAKAEQSSIAINALSRLGLDYLQPLLERAGAEPLIRQNGALYIYETPSQFSRAKLNCSYYERRGVDYQVIQGADLRSLEPSLRLGIAGAIMVPGGAHTVSPLAMSRSLFSLFQSQGGEFVQAEVTGFEQQGNFVASVCAGRRISCAEVFITAGAYSKALAKQLGSSILLDTERGYHMHLPDPGIVVKRPLLFAGRAFAATSMRDGLRLAGTVEFAGLKAPANYARAQILVKQAAYLFPGLNTQHGKPWMGFRPSTPDTVPVISSSPKYSNVFFGFGHGHLGLTQAGITGAMLGALASGETSPVDIDAFRIDRSMA